MKDIIARLARLYPSIVVDFRNGNVEKDGVIVTTVKISPEGLTNLLTSIKLGLI